jgi:hypothetical protein
MAWKKVMVNVVPALVVLLLGSIAPMRTDNATARERTVGGSTAHGVGLYLSIPRQRYPLDALVLATISIRNLSHHTIQVPVVGTACSAVVVQVYDRPQRPLFPPTFPGALEVVSCTPQVPTVSLAPGATKVSRLPVILRGPHLRLVATLPFVGAAIVTTPAITVQLTPRAGAPMVTVHTRPTLYADVHPPQRPSGPLLITDWLACHHGSRISGDPWSSPWSSRTSERITPEWHRLPKCTGQREWHVLAGYLNHPVVHIDWKQG